MTKRKKNNKKIPVNNNLILGVVFAVIVSAIGFFSLSNNAQTSVTATIQSQTISPQDYQSAYLANDTDHTLLDVRTPEEFSSGHIAGAINIPVQQLSQRLNELPTDKDIVVYCRSGNRSATASTILVENGFSDIHDMGGIIAWQQAGYSVVQ